MRTHQVCGSFKVTIKHPDGVTTFYRYVGPFRDQTTLKRFASRLYLEGFQHSICARHVSPRDFSSHRIERSPTPMKPDEFLRFLENRLNAMEMEIAICTLPG